MAIQKWYNPEIKRPDDSSEIIFIDSVGMYKGTFFTTRNGVVYVDGKEADQVEWGDIYQWIYYPDEF